MITEPLRIRPAAHEDGTVCVIETVHQALWDHQGTTPAVADILRSCDIHPADLTLYSQHRGDTSVAGAFARLYKFGASRRISTNQSTAGAADGMARTSIHVLSGWAAVLMHPTINEHDRWRVHSAISDLIVPYRRTRHGWLYAAAGVTTSEARRLPPADAAMMAALRGHVLPVPQDRNAAPLVARKQ